MVDIRLPIPLDLLEFREGSILALPYEDKSVPSVSSICVVEHTGLGRYGDPIDPLGSEKVLVELKRIVKPAAASMSVSQLMMKTGYTSTCIALSTRIIYSPYLRPLRSPKSAISTGVSLASRSKVGSELAAITLEHPSKGKTEISSHSRGRKRSSWRHWIDIAIRIRLSRSICSTSTLKGTSLKRSRARPVCCQKGISKRSSLSTVAALMLACCSKTFFELFSPLPYRFYKIYPNEIRLVERYSQRLENFQYQNWAVLRNDAN